MLDHSSCNRFIWWIVFFGAKTKTMMRLLSLITAERSVTSTRILQDSQHQIHVQSFANEEILNVAFRLGNEGFLRFKHKQLSFHGKFPMWKYIFREWCILSLYLPEVTLSWSNECRWPLTMLYISGIFISRSDSCKLTKWLKGMSGFIRYQAVIDIKTPNHRFRWYCCYETSWWSIYHDVSFDL